MSEEIARTQDLPLAGNSREDVREFRLAEISRRRASGETLTQIAQALGIGLATVSRDMEIVRARWHEECIQSIEAHRAKQLAALDVVTQGAIEDRQWSAAANAIQGAAKLLGSNAPEKQDIRVLGESAARIGEAMREAFGRAVSSGLISQSQADELMAMIAGCIDEGLSRSASDGLGVV